MKPGVEGCVGGALFKASLRANGSRECAPDDRLREAIQATEKSEMDCFVASLLAMTANAKHAFAFPRHVLPGVCQKFPPLQSEGAGKTGCALHPRSRVQGRVKKRTRAYRFSGGS